jgi:hypothetical protein
MDKVSVLLIPAVFFSLAGLIVREAYQYEKRRHALASTTSPHHSV